MWVILGFWAINIEKRVCRENSVVHTDYNARQTIHFKRQHVLEVTTTKTSATLRERKTIYCALQESHTWIEFSTFFCECYENIFDVPVYIKAVPFDLCPPHIAQWTTVWIKVK